MLCRMKRDDIQSSLSKRKMMDRRRLEDSFLLYASLEVIKKYSLQISHYPCDRNNLVEALTEQYHEAFINKWGGKMRMMFILCCRLLYILHVMR